MIDHGIAGGAPRLTRRQWLARLPAPAALAAAAGLASGSERALAAPEPRPNANSLGTRTYDVRHFGAKGDGVALDSPALQAAIDACTRDGGGTVLLPAGTFLIGSTELKSNVTLRLAAGAILRGSGDGRHYHPVDRVPLTGDATLEDGNWALLFAVDSHNIMIEGPGTIDGQGARFRIPRSGEPARSGLSDLQRPYHLLAYRCENLRVRDLDLVDSAYHSLRIVQCRRVHMDGLYIHNRVNANNDGFHFISAEHVTVTNCSVLCQDDACALFGSCKYVMVTNCTFSTRWSVFRFGGGHAEKIAVSNCVLDHVYGCPIKFQATPGSRFEDISFANLLFNDVTGPIHIAAGPRPVAGPSLHGDPGMDTHPATVPDGRPPAVVRNVSFSNISGTVTGSVSSFPELPGPVETYPGEGRTAITLSAVAGAVVENISLSGIHLTFPGGGTAAEAARRELPVIADEYFRFGATPAYGLYARGVRGLTLTDLRLRAATPDLRPAVVFDRVTDAAVLALSVDGNPAGASSVRLTGCEDVLLAAPRLLSPAAAFLALEGVANQRITLDGGDLSRAARPLTLSGGANSQVVRHRE